VTGKKKSRLKGKVVLERPTLLIEADKVQRPKSILQEETESNSSDVEDTGEDSEIPQEKSKKSKKKNKKAKKKTEKEISEQSLRIEKPIIKSQTTSNEDRDQKMKDSTLIKRRKSTAGNAPGWRSISTLKKSERTDFVLCVFTLLALLYVLWKIFRRT